MKSITRPLAFVPLLALALFLASPALTAQDSPRPLKPDRGDMPTSTLYDYGVMGPNATPEIVAAADKAVTTPMAPGPVAPTWDSIQKNYQTPSWFEDAKFGIFMHWGIYSVAAHGGGNNNSAAEWYEKHMYSGGAELQWHIDHFGDPAAGGGYKNLISLFTAKNWDPDAWAALFKKAGAKFVVPTAEHHDNFANWDSQVTPFNAKRMGPMRDLIGDLAVAARKQGLKFGVSNHGMENFTFIVPDPTLNARLKAAQADLYDPAWVDFYHVADRSDASMTRFLTDWVNRNLELIDKYQPDILWFDNGVNLRVLDPLKEHVAAYFYNRAQQWGKEVSISTKYIAYAPGNDDTKQIGSIIDFEKVGTRSPPGIRPGPWMVDDPIGSTWGYSTAMTVSNANAVLGKLIDTVSKGGDFLLNISPMADGTIPDAQQTTLLGIGAWLNVNGDAIYGTRAWTRFSEGGTGRGALSYHFTTKGDTLYAIASAWPGAQALIASLAKGAVATNGPIKVELLGHDGALDSTQDETGLKITLPADRPPGGANYFALKITGFNLHAAAIAQ
jgi:alpha-L-fucosidase